MELICASLWTYIIRYFFKLKTEVIIPLWDLQEFSFLIFLFGGYDISWVSELQRTATAYKEGDYDTALQIFTPLAEKGDMVAQFNLAKMYRKGTGVPKDYKAAVK